MLLERWQNPKTARAMRSVGLDYIKQSLGTNTFFRYQEIQIKQPFFEMVGQWLGNCKIKKPVILEKQVITDF